MSSYEVTVNVSESTVEYLKREGYHLCVAKDMGYFFKVIWFTTPAQKVTTIKWDDSDNMQVYRASGFSGASLVSAVTKPHQIRMGYGINIAENGEIESTYGGAENNIFIHNKYGPTHLALDQPVSVNGEAPVLRFVAINPEPFEKSSSTYDFSVDLPRIALFWDRKLDVGMMFDSKIKAGHVIKLNDLKKAEVDYISDEGGGIWIDEKHSATLPMVISPDEMNPTPPDDYDPEHSSKLISQWIEEQGGEWSLPRRGWREGGKAALTYRLASHVPIARTYLSGNFKNQNVLIEPGESKGAVLNVSIQFTPVTFLKEYMTGGGGAPTLEWTLEAITKMCVVQPESISYHR